MARWGKRLVVLAGSRAAVGRVRRAGSPAPGGGRLATSGWPARLPALDATGRSDRPNRRPRTTTEAKPHAGAAKGDPVDVRQPGTPRPRSGWPPPAVGPAQGPAGGPALVPVDRWPGRVDIDPLTGTPRQVARLDGLLTGPSAAAPSAVASRYVRAHLAGVRPRHDADVSGLSLARDYVDVEGIHHLSFTQSAGGLTVFGNGLKANVTRDGRLINVTGSPVHALQAPSAAKSGLTGSQAITAAKRDMGEPVVAAGPQDTAKAVALPDRRRCSPGLADRHDERGQADAERRRCRDGPHPLPRPLLGSDLTARSGRPATRPTSSTTTPGRRRAGHCTRSR